MNPNIAALLEACNNRALRTEVIHDTGNLVRVFDGEKTALFANWTTPLTSHSDARIARDKDYTYQLLKNAISMPAMSAFLNPDCAPLHQHYLRCRTIDEIIAAVLARFDFPLVVKPNSGSKGRGVVVVRDDEELRRALERIFDMQSSDYDYVAVAQQWIDVSREYRIVYVDRKIVMQYEKPRADLFVADNLRQRWTHGRARLVTDDGIVGDFDGFCQPIFTRFPLRFCGLDVVVDRRDRKYLLEINTSPGFEYIIRDSGPDAAIAVYNAVLDAL